MLTEEVLNKLDLAGHRTTTSRRKLVEAILARGEGFTAEELVAQLKNVGRATVYRTIRLLVNTGVLCKLALHNGAPRYTISGMGHHHHVVCVRCGDVREFRESAIETLLRGLEETEQTAIVGHRIELYVMCSRCSPLPEPTRGPSSQPAVAALAR